MTISMSADILWFYESGGERRGPVTATELLELRLRGEIQADSLVWRDGLPDWIPFASSGLAPVSTKSPGPPPVPMLAPMGPPPVPVSAPVFVPRAVRLRPDFRPSIRSCFGRAWELLKSRFWPFVGCFALLNVILTAAYQFLLPAFFLTLPLVAGFYYYTLCVIRNRTPSMDMIFEGFRRQFGALAITNLILSAVSIAVFLVAALVFGGAFLWLNSNTSMFSSFNPEFVGVGFFLGYFLYFGFLLPLVIGGFVAIFAIPILMESDCKAGEALALAWQATKPNLLKIGVFSVLCILLSYVGMMAFFVGAFITGAWSTIACVYLYEDAFGEDKAED
jgi:hypothetical protein